MVRNREILEHVSGAAGSVPETEATHGPGPGRTRLVPRSLRLTSPLDRLDAISADQRGITTVQASVGVLILMVIAGVYLAAVVTTGVFSSEGSQSALGSLEETTTRQLKLRGPLVAHLSDGSQSVERVQFLVTNGAARGEPIVLVESGLGATTVTYIDSNQAVNISNSDWSAEFLMGSGGLLKPGDVAEITVSFADLGSPLGAATDFTVEVRPNNGSVLQINRRTPTDLTKIMVLR